MPDIDYKSPATSAPPKDRSKVWRLATLLGTGTIAIAIALWANGTMYRWFHVPNAPWNYSSEVGANLALDLTRLALIDYMSANDGQVPADLWKVTPYIRTMQRETRVTPEQLIPYIKVFPLGGQPLPPNTHLGPPGRFVLMVHVLRAGPMHFDRTIIATEGSSASGYHDDDAVAEFGKDRIIEAKSSAFQLP
jgi:hypothetical protein